MTPIRLDSIEDPFQAAAADGSAALALAPDVPVVLRFAIAADDPKALEALRYARRSLLREEWTLGRNPEEPSLGEAVFTPTEVIWQVRRDQRDACLQKVEDLASRANRLLGGI